MYNGFCFDIESDGFLFESTKVWVIWLKDLDDPTKKIKLNPFRDSKAKDKFVEFISSYENRPLIVGHNILGFDNFILRCLMDLNFQIGKKSGDTIEDIPVQFVDTYYWSMFLWPDRPAHSVSYFGEKLGLDKIDFRQASVNSHIIPSTAPQGSEFKQHSKLMDEYCERDVDVNILIFKSLMAEWKELYGKDKFPTGAFKAGQKSFFLMSCQEYSGFKFDIEYAHELKIKIANMMEKIRSEVEPQLPPRGLKKTEQKEYMVPAKPFKKDGEYSSHMENFISKHNGEKVEHGKVKFFGKIYNVESGSMLDISKPMEMANQAQIKEWLLECGWEPTLWNFKRGPDGKPCRDPVTRQLTKTTPKMQEQGKLCPNLEEMEGPLVKEIVKWLSLRNRQSVLEGWMTDPRLEYDGRISAGRSGIASTHRQRHKNVVNVPKADPKVLLGNEFRSLWISESGNFIAAGDAAALEGRVQGHYTWKYDNGQTAKELLEGDVHSKNAKAFYSHLPEMKKFNPSDPNFDKEDLNFKPFRNKSKNGYYATMYGCAAPKLASTLGISESLGQSALDKFWEANPGTKKLKDNLESYWETTGKKKYLPAIDGRILHTRKKSALLNTIFQSCGGIVMDYACCFMDSWLGDIYFDELRRPYYLYKGCVVKRIAYMHDEMEFEVPEQIAEEVCKMIEKAIEKAGQLLGIKVPLAGEGKFGVNWKEVH